MSVRSKVGRACLSCVACMAFTIAPSLTFANTPLITIDVHNANLSDVIALLAAQAGENIVVDSSLKPERVTLHLHDVSFSDALGVLASSHGLQVHRDGSALIVGDAGAMNRRYDSDNTPFGAQTVVLPLAHASPEQVAKEITGALPDGTVIVPDVRTSAVLVSGDRETVERARSLVGALDAPVVANSTTQATHSYALRYMKADAVVSQLKLIDPTGTYLADLAHNAVIVRGGSANRTAQNLIASVDAPSAQVMFEVKVADVTPQNDSSNFGLEFGGVDFSGNALAGATTYAFKGGSIPINVRLNALVTSGRAQILATPKLVTLNNTEADLLIGETYPIVFNTSVLGGQNVQFVDIGVKLRMTPTIGPDGDITAELHPEYSELLGFTSSGYPIIANRKIDATLRVRDNETIVLGGLMRDVSSETLEKIPGLANIPIIGSFFKNKTTSHERDEIVFLITPHVIYPGKPSPYVK